MKICLSRKGFDSQYGGMASPILPDGTLVPLPIPTSHDLATMRDINLPNVDVEQLLTDLSRGRLSMMTTVHLDPDLDKAPESRHFGWRPALGQTRAAQGHLNKLCFGQGDVFLFFGWFRQVEQVKGVWRYVPSAPDLHVLFGWLEVAEVLPIVTKRDACLFRHPWIANHPHVVLPEHYQDPLNHLYLSTLKSRFVPNAPFGAGRFPKYKEVLQLTQTGKTRSVWRLPDWFIPKNGRPSLSYHPVGPRWSRDDHGVILRSAAKGQEFVLDCDYYPEAESWLEELLRGSIRKHGT